jgi:hypothetical protein
MPPRCSWCGRETMTHAVATNSTENGWLQLCMECLARWKVKDEQERISAKVDAYFATATSEQLRADIQAANDRLARAETDELPAVEAEA